MNPYRTAMQVYQDKITEETEEIDNEAMRQGREFEDYVAKRFVEATGKKVRRANAMFYDEKYPFMLADVDRMVVGENAGLECKTASPYMADKWENGKIPLSYQIQCHHYISVCNAEAWYIAVLIYGREFKYYRIERDEEILADLVGRCCFYRYVQCFCKTLKGFNKKLERRQELADRMSALETEKRLIEQELKLYLGEAESAENEKYRVSWKSVSSSRLDEKRLKEEKPEVYNQYQKTILSRRFTVKAA